MKNKLFLFASIACFALWGFFSSCNNNHQSKNKIIFHFNLEQGATYHYTIKDEQKVGSPVGDMSLSSAIGVDYKKVKDSAGLQIINSTVKSVLVQIHSGNTNVTYDSKEGVMPTSSQFALAQLFQLIDKPFFIYLNPDGTIQKISGLPDGNAPGSNDSLLMQTFEKSFDFYPNHPVAIGESWTTTTQLPVQGIPNYLQTNYSLQSVEGDTAFITVKGTLEAKDRTLIINDIPMKIGMAGTQTGNLKILIEEGRLLNAGFSSKITGVYKAMGQEKRTTTIGSSSIVSEKE